MTLRVSHAPKAWNLDDAPNGVPLSHEEAIGRVQWMLANHAANAPGRLVHLCLAIVQRETGRIIGWCGLDRRDAGKAHPVLFYLLQAAHWGQGLATEAARAVLDYAFGELALVRVDAAAAADNAASVRVLEKIGMRRLGRDEEGGHAFSLTRDEFLAHALRRSTMFEVTEAWRVAYPDAHAGFLIMQDVENPARHPGLEAEKQTLEGRLRGRFAGQDRRALETYGPVPAYTAYYKQFDKTYHVLAQLASIVLKGKAIPSVAALVEAMFMAEVKNCLLTAGHDLGHLQLPVTVGVASGEERYTLLRGQVQGCKAGDMLMADRAGVISSIVYGPDERSQITAATRNVVFAVYAPAGIDPRAVQAHLRDIRDYVLIVAPAAQVQALQVIPG